MIPSNVVGYAPTPDPKATPDTCVEAGPVDVLVLTALQDELEAVLALDEKGRAGWHERKDEKDFRLYRRAFPNGRGRAHDRRRVDRQDGRTRRGLPFTWIPTHLGDAAGVATPRSFLAALRTAADETADNAARALDWKSIHGGVRKASEIRVIELAEDFPWTKPAMEALEGLNVPCDSKDLVARWTSKDVLRTIEDEPEGRINKGARRGLPGLLDDLVAVGVLEVRPDGRYNIPDVYRVGFGLKRRGGVRPVR